MLSPLISKSMGEIQFKVTCSRSQMGMSELTGSSEKASTATQLSGTAEQELTGRSIENCCLFVATIFLGVWKDTCSSFYTPFLSFSPPSFPMCFPSWWPSYRLTSVPPLITYGQNKCLSFCQTNCKVQMRANGHIYSDYEVEKLILQIHKLDG